ncbi:MAG TPA: hypothetical protein VGQ83_20405 [Polyangia bacterium]|jgi:hypothetical protein
MRRRLRFCLRGIAAAAVALAAAGVVGCYGDKTSTMPAGLEPVGKNPAEYPPAEGTDQYPEKYGTMLSGKTDTYSWAGLKGYIHAPIEAVWAALQDPDTVADRRKVDKYVATLNVETGYDVSFRLANTVYDIITVEFEVTWRQSHIDGTLEAPLAVAANYQKTWGSSVMELLAGSVALKKIDDNTTAFECLEYIAAIMSADESVQSYQPDLYNSVKAKAHGDPLPTY